MKHTLLSLISTLSCALAFGVACDLEKEDGADTGAVGEDEDDGQDEDDGESNADDSVSTSAGSGPDDDTAGTTDDANDDDGDGDDDDDDDDGETTGEVGDGEPHAFAIAHADLPELDPGGESSSVGGGEDSIPPDAVHVTISGSGVATCEMPYEGEPCGGNWSVSFLLMPEMLEGSGTYNLFEEANGFQSYAGEPYEAGDCGWGGGTLDGVLVIEEITDDAIIGHLEDTDAFDFDANIEFEAPFC